MRVCLVDVSASVVRTRPDWRASALERISAEASEARELGHEILVVAFAGEVARVAGPGEPNELELDPGALRVVRDGESDLSAALTGVETMLRRARGSADLRCIGDGTWTGADPAGAIATWLAEGATFRTIPLPPPARIDAALTRLRLPREIEAEAPLAVACDVALIGEPASEGLEVVLELEIDDARGPRRLEQRARVPASAIRAPWTVTCDLGAAAEGRTRVRARVIAAGDPIPENDIASASTRSRGARVVGFLAGAVARDATPSLRSLWSSAPGLSAVELEPGDLTTALAGLDALVTLDIDPRELPRDALLEFVRGGRGWIAAGGHGLIEAKSASEPDAATRALPLEIDEEDDSPRDVELVVDASGSMAGEAMDAVRVAAVELVASARERDEVALRFFTRTLEPPIELGRGGADAAQREKAAAALVGARSPGGATDVAAALEALAGERESAGRSSLVLFLTDGRDQGATGNLERARAALARLGAASARIAIVAIGSQADLGYLDDLVRGVAAASLVRSDAAELASAFQDELAHGRLVENSVVVRATAEMELEGVAELAAALEAARPPAISRAARMRARDGDGVALTTVEGRPLLAWRREGLGIAGTLATLPDADWAHGWIEWEGWIPLLRFAARSSEPARRVPSARLRDHREIRVEGAPPDWPAGVAAVLRTPLGDAFPLALDVDASDPTRAPGEIRVATAPEGWTAAAGEHELAIDGPDGVRLATLPLIVACAEEFRWPPRSIPVLPDSGLGPRVVAGPHPRHPLAARSLLAASIALIGLGACLGAPSGRRRGAESKVKPKEVPADRAREPGAHAAPDPKRMRSRTLLVAVLLPILLGLNACASGTKKSEHEGEWLKPSPALRMQIEDQIARLPWTHGLERIEQIQWLAGAGEPAYPFLLDACLDKRPDVAASAVGALGATGDSRLVEPLRSLKWPKNDDLALRYEKARAFLRLGDWTAIDTLVDGLEEENPWARGLCLMALVEATHVDFAFDPVGTPEARAAAVGRWREWVKSRQREGILADASDSPDR